MKRVIDDAVLTDIADAIREKNGTEVTYQETEMAEAIKKSGYKFKNFAYFCYQGNRVFDLDSVDTSEGTDFSHMFCNCSNVRYMNISELDTSKGTDFSGMFYGCTNLEIVPNLDTSNGTEFSEMFCSCKKLTSIPQLDTSNGSFFNGMFQNCYKLTSIPNLDTSKGIYLREMFSGCQALISIPRLDVGRNSDFSNMFRNCYVLQDLYLYNIKQSITIGSGISYGHLLTLDSLIHIINELCPTDITQTLTMGGANVEKLNGLYCRIIDETNEKLPMVLCESTDDGAMLVSDYITGKGWAYD